MSILVFDRLENIRLRKESRWKKNVIFALLLDAPYILDTYFWIWWIQSSVLHTNGRQNDETSTSFTQTWEMSFGLSTSLPISSLWWLLWLQYFIECLSQGTKSDKTRGSCFGWTSIICHCRSLNVSDKKAAQLNSFGQRVFREAVVSNNIEGPLKYPTLQFCLTSVLNGIE